MLWFGFSMVALNWGEQEVDAATAALVVLMSWPALGEVPGPLTLVGGALCLAGVAVSRYRSGPARARTAAVPAPETQRREPQADRASGSA